MSRDESGAGLSGLLFGRTWQTAAWRGAIVFVLFYVMPLVLLAPSSRLADFLQLLATVAAYCLVAASIYMLLQSKADDELVLDDSLDTEERHVPVSVPAAELPEPVNAESHAVSQQEALQLATLGQAALERVCIALYQFNGLNSQTIAIGAEGGYRIRLVPRNTTKAMALLRCCAGSEVQGVGAYTSLLRDMEDEGLEKAFFIAPAGFDPNVTATARSRHVTLVDLKLLQAMLDRLPDPARAVVLEAAG